MPTEIIVEGKVDAKVVELLCGSDLPPGKVKTPNETAQGRPNAIRTAAEAVKQVGEHRIVLLIDRDDDTESGLNEIVERELSRSWKAKVELTAGWYVRGRSSVRFVLAGRPSDGQLDQLGINTWSLDDYILRLFLEDSCLRRFCDEESQNRFRGGSTELLEVLIACRGTLSNHGVGIDSAKRYLDLIDVILPFNASPVTRFEKLWQRSVPVLRNEVFIELKTQLLQDPPFPG